MTNQELPRLHFFAEVSWSAEDVQTARPDLTTEQAEDFLQRNEKHLRDRLTELGWDVMQDLIQMDDELPPPFGVGDRVIWNDPDGEPDEDGGTCSGPGVIVSIEGDIFAIQKDDGSEVEAYGHELTREENVSK